MKAHAALAAGAFLLATPLLALAAPGCLPRLERGWIRPPAAAGAMPMAAGFGRLVNPCPGAFQVVGVHSAAFGEVSLHQTRQVDGVSRMRAVDTLSLPPGASVALAPGGYHLMLMAPAAPLQPGQRLPIGFDLAGGGGIQGEFEVRASAP